MPGPPRSTLFPYTTLFRSELQSALGDARQLADTLRRLSLLGEMLQSCREPDEAIAVIERALDRKSTRLNSSHPSISYAVFCLKKKMKLSSFAVPRPGITAD